MKSNGHIIDFRVESSDIHFNLLQIIMLTRSDVLNEISDVRDSTLSGTVCIIIISPSGPLISLKKTAHLCGICLESASPTASWVFISLINYVASQTAFENTSKTGIMCLVGLQFSVSQLNCQWSPGTICCMYSLNTSLHIMGTIHKDVQQFTTGKKNLYEPRCH